MPEGHLRGNVAYYLVAVAIVAQAVPGPLFTFAAYLGAVIRPAGFGVLGAPLWTSAVKTTEDFGIVLVGFVLLTAWRAPPFLIVILSALGGMVLV